MTTRLIQPSFTGGELADSLAARVDLAKYASGCRVMLNFFPHVHGGASNRPGLEYVGDVANHAVRGRLVPFVFNAEQTYVLEFGDGTMRIVTNGGYVVYPAGHAQAGKIVQIASPYPAAALPRLKYVQSADVMTLTHPDYTIRQLGRYAHHDWRFSEMSFVPSIAAPGSVNVPTIGKGSIYDKPQFDIVGYAITAVKAVTAEESAPAYSADVEVATDAHIDISWSAVAGAERYNIYKKRNGLYGYIGTANGASFRDTQKVEADLKDCPPKHENPFVGAGNYPGCVAYFQQRQVFAGSKSTPQTIRMSRAGNYRSMAVSSPTKADDAITSTLASGTLDAIRAFAPLQEMLVFTSGAVWKIGPGGNSDAVTPSSIQAQPQNWRGISHMPPLTVGNTVLFVQDKGSAVRDVGYSYDTDSYKDTDLSLLSNHLFQGYQLEEWAYSAVPHSLVWCVRNDGALLCMTYLREHEIWGWSRHTTDGVFESVCSVSEGAEDAVYVIVRRTINGQTRRFVERMASRAVLDVKDAFFVDAGLTYRGEPKAELSGLVHLEGKEVAILADGNVMPRQTVINGTIKLQHAASIIHVGLPYVAELETLEPEAPKGTIQGRRKRIVKITLRLNRSRGGWVGYDRDHLDELKQRTTEAMGEAIRLYSGDQEVNLPSTWNKGTIVLQQRDPLPITVLAALPDMEVGG